MFLQKINCVDAESNHRFVNASQGLIQLHGMRKMDLVRLESWEDLPYFHQAVGYSLECVG